MQEIAYAMTNAIAVLDAVARARRRGAAWARSSGASRSSSTPACASSRSTRSCARWAILWEELGRERYGVTDAKQLRFRYGVQVNSLGLTESQPENNVQRIVLEALAVTLGRDARARAIQLPAWNEALGLPRPWDQQWSLRIQQVLAFETDLLEYPDIFEGSDGDGGLVAELLEGARAEMAVVAEHGGAVEAVRLHEGRARRLPPRAHPPHRGGRADRRRHQQVHRDRALAARRGRGRRHPDRRSGRRGRSRARRSTRWRAERDQAAVDAALAELRPRGRSADENIMEATIAAARAGVTTGEWAQALRDAFGEYRAPTGVGEAAAGAADSDGARGAARGGRRASARRSGAG